MEDKRPQCTKTTRSGKINRIRLMRFGQICAPLVTLKGCQKFPLVKKRKNEGHALQIRRLIFASLLGYPTFKGVKKINLKCQYLFVIEAINLVSSNWNQFRTDPSWWTWDGLVPTSCGNAGKLCYNMIRRRITEIILPDPATWVCVNTHCHTNPPPLFLNYSGGNMWRDIP
jgi:hypothetical protein